MSTSGQPPPGTRHRVNKQLAPKNNLKIIWIEVAGGDTGQLSNSGADQWSMIPLPMMNGLLCEMYLSWISSAVIEAGTQSTPNDGAIGGSFASNARW